MHNHDWKSFSVWIYIVKNHFMKGCIWFFHEFLTQLPLPFKSSSEYNDLWKYSMWWSFSSILFTVLLYIETCVASFSSKCRTIICIMEEYIVRCGMRKKWRKIWGKHCQTNEDELLHNRWWQFIMLATYRYSIVINTVIFKSIYLPFLLKGIKDSILSFIFFFDWTLLYYYYIHFMTSIFD